MNNSYTFQMAYLDKQSIRTSFIENGELDLHHNFSSYNRPYTAFQVANKRMTIDGIETSNGWGGSNNRPRPTNWESLVKTVDYLVVYVQITLRMLISLIKVHGEHLIKENL